MGKALVPAGPTLPARRPKEWDKWVSAAYLRILGHTQDQAAEAVGRAGRTLREWESQDDLWEEARSEARRRWLAELGDVSRRTVLREAEKDADLAFRVLERLDPDLAPPKQKHEHTGEGGGPIAAELTVRFVRPVDVD